MPHLLPNAVIWAKQILLKTWYILLLRNLTLTILLVIFNEQPKICLKLTQRSLENWELAKSRYQQSYRKFSKFPSEMYEYLFVNLRNWFRYNHGIRTYWIHTNCVFAVTDVLLVSFKLVLSLNSIVFFFLGDVWRKSARPKKHC